MRATDFQTGTWKRIALHLEKRLQDLRETNDRAADQNTTSTTRGQIAEVKRMLSLPDDWSDSSSAPRSNELPSDNDD